MKLSLAIALFFAATFDVQAAPQAKSKRAEASKVVQMVTVSGECTRLVQASLEIGLQDNPGEHELQHRGEFVLVYDREHHSVIFRRWFPADRTRA